MFETWSLDFVTSFKTNLFPRLFLHFNKSLQVSKHERDFTIMITDPFLKLFNL